MTSRISLKVFCLLLTFVVVNSGCQGTQSQDRSATGTGIASTGGEGTAPEGEEEAAPPLPEVEPMPPLSGNERQVGLRAGRAAPFDGVLFSPEAVARIEVEFRVLRQQFVLDLELQRRELTARRVRDVSALELRLRTSEEEHRILLAGRDRELARVRTALREASESNNPNILASILSAIGGVVVGVLVGWFVGTVSN